jgi:hypothetical protein
MRKPCGRVCEGAQVCVRREKEERRDEIVSVWALIRMRIKIESV